MTIYHEAYLFKSAEFAATMMPIVAGLREGHGEASFTALRDYVINLFDTNPLVKHLADYCGAWDKQTIIEDSAIEPPYPPRDIAFLMVFAVYGHLIASGHLRLDRQLGLRAKDEILSQALRLLGWSKADSIMLTDGESFYRFAQQWFPKEDQSEVEEFWDSIHPASTLGHAGWIDNAHAETFLARLVEDEPKLADLTWPNDARGNIESAREAYQAAKQMFQVAQEANSDLGIIISG